MIHEFVPIRLTEDDPPGHVCNGRCYCAECGQAKANRAYHVQHRRTKEVHHEQSPATPAGSTERETMEGGES